MYMNRIHFFQLMHVINYHVKILAAVLVLMMIMSVNVLLLIMVNDRVH